MRVHRHLEGPPDAPVLVLSNSLGTTLELWDPNVGRLAKDLRVLRYDQRGHGRSPVPPGPYRVEDLVGDVIELLDELELERVSFCGISLGGAVGLLLGATAPERLDALVVASASAHFGPADAWSRRARTVRMHGVSAISETVLERWFSPAFRRDHPEVVDRFRRMLIATPSEGYAGCCKAVAAWDFADRLTEVHVPTLVVAAADDPATPPEHGLLIADGVPGAELAVVERAAHLANVERPDEFVRLVLDHVALSVGETT